MIAGGCDGFISASSSAARVLLQSLSVKPPVIRQIRSCTGYGARLCYRIAIAEEPVMETE